MTKIKLIFCPDCKKYFKIKQMLRINGDSIECPNGDLLSIDIISPFYNILDIPIKQ